MANGEWNASNSFIDIIQAPGPMMMTTAVEIDAIHRSVMVMNVIAIHQRLRGLPGLRGDA